MKQQQEEDGEQENICKHAAADAPNNNASIAGQDDEEETTPNPMSTTTSGGSCLTTAVSHHHPQSERSTATKRQNQVTSKSIATSSPTAAVSSGNATVTTLIHRKKNAKAHYGDTDKQTLADTSSELADPAHARQSSRSRIHHDGSRNHSSNSKLEMMKKSPSSSSNAASLISSLTSPSSSQSRIRIVLFVLVVCIATSVISYGVYYYIYTDEYNQFQQQFLQHSNDIVDNLRVGIDQKLNTIDTLSTSITNIAQTTNQTFPFVTIPNFSILGNNIRILADALIIHWLPLVTDQNRLEWEQYSFDNRFQIDVSYEQDSLLRKQQDIDFGYAAKDAQADEGNGEGTNNNRLLALASVDRLLQQGDEEEDGNDETSTLPEGSTGQDSSPSSSAIDPNIVPDGTGFHTQIYNFSTKEPLPNSTGPYLPIWQRSPVNMQKQKSLNIDFSKAKVFQGILPVMLNDHNYEDSSGSGGGGGKVVLNRASIPTITGQANFNANLLLGQYRHDLGSGADHRDTSSIVVPDNSNDPQRQQQPDDQKYLLDPLSFLAYPVYDRFDAIGERKFVGVVASNIYWRLYFENVLPSDVIGMIVVMENSFNQTFTYRIDGKDTIFLGEGDTYHDSYYEDYMETTEIVNEYVQQQASTKTRSYTTVPLHDTYGIYQIRIYPTREFQNLHVTNKPILYGIIVACLLLCMLLALVILLSRVISQKAKAKTEKDLTSYFAHELRNPLSAIDSALHTILLDNNNSSKDKDKRDNNGGDSLQRAAQKQPQRQAHQSVEGNLHDEDELHEVLTGIRSCTDFMSSMMNNLLDARQLEEGRMVLHPKPLSLSELVMDVHGILESSVKSNVTFEYRCPHTISPTRDDRRIGEGDWVLGDGYRLKQVLTNVAMNAIKYTTTGSIVLSVFWSKEEESGIRKGKSIHKHRSHVCFKCEDTGPGIPKKDQQKLFRKFVQRGGAPGAGIGLSLAKSIVDIMDGTIQFESDPPTNPGTTCIISLPLEPTHAPQSSLTESVLPDFDNGTTVVMKGDNRGVTPDEAKPVGENSVEKPYKPSVIKNLASSGCSDTAPSQATDTNCMQKNVSSPMPILEHISILIVDVSLMPCLRSVFAGNK